MLHTYQPVAIPPIHFEGAVSFFVDDVAIEQAGIAVAKERVLIGLPSRKVAIEAAVKKDERIHSFELFCERMGMRLLKHSTSMHIICENANGALVRYWVKPA